jgi:UDP-2,3-diacylglucosamine hydrolase
LHIIVKKLLFVSDIHLHDADPALTECFLSFLHTHACGADELYILGDLFDRWIGDDDQTPYNRQIIQALKNLRKTDTRLYFQHGNRDFLIGARFAKETGCTILKEEHLLVLENTSALLMHGDSLCTDDTDYQQAREMLRGLKWKNEFLEKTIAERNSIADQYRRRSRQNTKKKSMEMMDVTLDAVCHAMLRHKSRLLVHGHTHKPAEHHLMLGDLPARRIVLGDWHGQKSSQYLEYHNGKWLRQAFNP